MAENITLKFRYTEQDYIAAMRLWYIRVKKLRVKLDGIIALILAVFGAIAWHMFGYSIEFLTIIIVGCVFLLLIFMAMVVIPRITFRSQPKFRDEYQLRFTEDGIEFKTQSIDSKLEWNLYNQLVEDDKTYLLIYGKSMFSAIPKRVFANEAEEMKFKELVKRKIATCC
ncbi:MAG: YcxB family protein [Armatimonadota bacterium]